MKSQGANVAIRTSLPFQSLLRLHSFPFPLPSFILFFFQKFSFFFQSAFRSGRSRNAGLSRRQEDEMRASRLPFCWPPPRSGADPQQPPGPVHRPRSRKRRCLRQKEHGLVPAPFRQDLGPDGLPDSVHVMTILLISRNSGIDVARRGEARCPRSGANMVQSPGQVYGVSQGRFFPPIPFSSCSSSPCLFSLPPSLPPSLHPPPSLSASLPSFFSLSFLPSLPLPFSPSLSLSASLLSSFSSVALLDRHLPSTYYVPGSKTGEMQPLPLEAQLLSLAREPGSPREGCGSPPPHLHARGRQAWVISRVFSRLPFSTTMPRGRSGKRVKRPAPRSCF